MKKALTLVAASMMAVVAFAGEFPDISISEVRALAASKKAVIIDVNGSESFKEGHVPGALDFDSVKGKLDLTNTLLCRFDAKEIEVNVPWDKINMLEYGQKVGRRIGLAIVVSPLFLMTKSRKHFLTVSYLDEKDRQQALVFEIHKDHVRSVLVTMEARTGLRVEFQDNEARFGGESQ